MPRFYFHWGQHFSLDIFCFHIIKSLMAILTLLSTLFNYEKIRMKASS